ncbi:MAG: hypothetical protein ACI8X5_001959 [Planctomycetota bacterium]|jgi:hypothetical protein
MALTGANKVGAFKGKNTEPPSKHPSCGTESCTWALHYLALMELATEMGGRLKP